MMHVYFYLMFIVAIGRIIVVVLTDLNKKYGIWPQGEFGQAPQSVDVRRSGPHGGMCG